MAAERKKRRKRRDSSCALKPPLDFIESPLNGRKYYCTPVQAARRPFLAASLPVDDEGSVKWVGVRLLVVKCVFTQFLYSCMLIDKPKESLRRRLACFLANNTITYHLPAFSLS